MTVHALCNDAPLGHLQCSKKGGCAVAFVIMGHGSQSSPAKRQSRLGPVQRLNRGFLVGAQHLRVLGRVEIQPHHIDDFLCGMGRLDLDGRLNDQRGHPNSLACLSATPRSVLFIPANRFSTNRRRHRDTWRGSTPKNSEIVLFSRLAAAIRTILARFIKRVGDRRPRDHLVSVLTSFSLSSIRCATTWNLSPKVYSASTKNKFH